MSQYRIGAVTTRLGLSADTLRYYEKIGLLPRVGRDGGGMRLYNDKDMSRLRFIQRAQKMDFTLAEIGELLKMREAPQRARKAVRELTVTKLEKIQVRLKEITTLRNELRLLLNLCQASADGCPIIENIDQQPRKHGKYKRVFREEPRRRP